MNNGLNELSHKKTCFFFVVFFLAAQKNLDIKQLFSSRLAMLRKGGSTFALILRKRRFICSIFQNIYICTDIFLGKCYDCVNKILQNNQAISFTPNGTPFLIQAMELFNSCKGFRFGKTGTCVAMSEARCRTQNSWRTIR